MICQSKPPKACGGSGSVVINGLIVECPRCSGTGEEKKNPKNIPTYLPPKE